jgi:hypothetical protein
MKTDWLPRHFLIREKKEDALESSLLIEQKPIYRPFSLLIIFLLFHHSNYFFSFVFQRSSSEENNLESSIRMSIWLCCACLVHDNLYVFIHPRVTWTTWIFLAKSRWQACLLYTVKEIMKDICFIIKIMQLTNKMNCLRGNNLRLHNYLILCDDLWNKVVIDTTLMTSKMRDLGSIRWCYINILMDCGMNID